jgi:hypothetical protein
MNILPGLRELRAPLAAGYMWLITAWLWLDHFRLIPESRPVGGGWLAGLWSISTALGATTLLAILTFVAYLIGSFLEIDVDNSRLLKIIPLILRRRPTYKLYGLGHGGGSDWGFYLVPLRLRERWRRMGTSSVLEDRLKPELDQLVRDILPGFDDDDRMRTMKMYPATNLSSAVAIATSFSPLAREDLIKMLVVEGQVAPSRRVDDWFDTNDAFAMMPGAWTYVTGIRNLGADILLADLLSEISQLASRLLVKNKELYGRYDRFRSEASFRINVSIAMLALLGTATFLSHISWPVKTLLITVELAAAILLFRQGILRSISAPGRCRTSSCYWRGPISIYQWRGASIREWRRRAQAA